MTRTRRGRRPWRGKARRSPWPWTPMLDAVDAVVIAAPAEAHHALATQALSAGRHVLVEKPIAATLAQADALAALAAERRLVLQVGHPAALLRRAPRHLRPHRPAAVYRGDAHARRSSRAGTDVSVILDLMIHDLDLVLGAGGQRDRERGRAGCRRVSQRARGHRQRPRALRQRLCRHHHRQPHQHQDGTPDAPVRGRGLPVAPISARGSW